MSGERFTVDTNVLVYSVDRKADWRHAIAEAVMGKAGLGPCWLTLQSVSEFYAVITRKGMVPRDDARRLAEILLDVFPTQQGRQIVR